MACTGIICRYMYPTREGGGEGGRRGGGGRGGIGTCKIFGRGARHKGKNGTQKRFF